MAERPKHWIKLWVSWLTTPAHLELSGGALGLGPLLLLLATWDGGYEAGGWLLAEDGSPMSRNALARAVHLTRTHLDRYLGELIRCRTLTLRESDGALGFARFGHWQETSQATRMRRHRERHTERHTERHSDAVRDAQTVDGRRETVELASQVPPQTPPPDLALKPVEAKRPKSKPRGAPSELEPRIEQVLAAIDVQRKRHDLPPLTATQRNATTIAGAFGRGATVERLLEVVGAFGDLVERDPSKASVLCATTPFTGPSARGPGGLAWGESLLDEAATRARKAATRIGPAMPSADEVLADREREGAAR